jgi:peptidoglycan hydrolase-like protein with peptidoglycan-binding domain
MGIHAAERVNVDAGFTLNFAREPTLVESQVCQGVDWLETNYGRGWKGAGVGSRNRGAVQAGHPPCNTTTSFMYTDTHPNGDGTSTTYSICFKKYADDISACSDMERYIVGTTSAPKQNVLDACARGDLYGVSAGMHANHYYEGFGRTVADRIENHRKALAAAIKRRCDELDEPMPSGTPTVIQKIVRVAQGVFNAPKQPTLRRGSFGTAVKDWQRFLGVVADGAFGPVTESMTIAWQGQHKNVVTGKPLKIDGVVGTETWAAAEVEAATLPEAA